MFQGIMIKQGIYTHQKIVNTQCIEIDKRQLQPLFLDTDDYYYYYFNVFIHVAGFSHIR